MANPENFMDLIPSKIFNRAMQEPINNDDLQERFKPILRGAEEFNFTYDILLLYKYEFEAVLQDFVKCLRCNGQCKTSTPNMFNSISFSGMQFYAINRPMFSITICPGVVERKNQIKEQLLNGKLVIPEPDEKLSPEESHQRIEQCKDILKRGNLVDLSQYQNRRKYPDEYEE